MCGRGESMNWCRRWASPSSQKGRVLKLCKNIDERVNAFLDRPLEGEWPYLCSAHLPEGPRRRAHRSRCDNNRGGGIARRPARDRRPRYRSFRGGPFWSVFLKGLVKRGLKGVKLVISDAPDALRHAMTRVLSANWQRCRVHWIRNALAHVPKGQHTMVAAAIRKPSCRPKLRQRTRPGDTSPTSSACADRSSPR